MDVRWFAGGAGGRPRRGFVLMLAVALAAGLWAAAEARQALSALDHHATVLNGDLVGSAFLIAPDLAVTNAHVVEGLRPGDAVLLDSGRGGATARARVIAVSRRMDLALLRAPAGFAPVVRAANAPARFGLAVLGAGVDASGGRGSGPRIELAGAVIAARADLAAYGPGLVIAMPGVRPGFSGGPVIDAEGRLVGMITAIRARSGGAAAATSASPEPRNPPDEAFVLRAAAIRAEVRRLLRPAGE